MSTGDDLPVLYIPPENPPEAPTDAPPKYGIPLPDKPFKVATKNAKISIEDAIPHNANKQMI